jgi:thiol:disulfide interchange protein
MGKRFLIAFLLILLNWYCNAQVFNPVRWNFITKQVSENTFELQFTANIDPGWHMYGLHIPENGPIATSFSFAENKEVEYLSDATPVQKPVVKYDPTFEMDLELFSDKVTFLRTIKIVSVPKTEVTGTIEFMVCDDSRCLPPKEESFSFILEKTNITKAPGRKTNSQETASQAAVSIKSSDSIQADIASAEVKKTDIKPVGPEKQDENERSLFGLFLIAFLAGFGALLTPCVYPIIPLTVSFFMRDTSRSKAVFNGLFFGVSIIFIYTLVGLIVGLTQVDLVRLISSHWLPNLLFFLIFLALAFSFFGMFEITLPNSLSNKIDQQADRGGMLGPFFMALATVIISFSCTGPIVGVVLGGAMQGEIIKPVIGMLGFSISFALPFTLLALFPGFLKKIPKSGGWLNSVKVFFAFILLAFSLIFLSNLGLSFITRNVILIISIVIFVLFGMYLLGKIKFSHDSDMSHISVPRLLLSIAVLGFAVYLFTGLFGAPLKLVAPFLPAGEEVLIPLNDKTTASSEQFIGRNAGNICSETPKYSDILALPFGLKGYFDYEEALACARQINKPVLLDFAGHYCKNCKKMYAEVWADPRVQSLLRDSFIIASLYTDDRTELPAGDQVTSTLDGKVKKTIGKKFNDLQITKFGSNALPLYVIVNARGDILTKEKYYTYSPSVEDFIDFLNNGLEGFYR